MRGWVHGTVSLPTPPGFTPGGVDAQHPAPPQISSEGPCVVRSAGRLAENALNALCINIDDIQSLALSRKFHAGPIPVGKMPSLLPLCPNLDSGAEKPLADAGHAAVGSLPWFFHGNRRDEGGRILPFNCVHDSLATTTSRARASADEHAPVAPVTRIRAGRAGGARTQKDERNAAGCSCVLI